MNDPDNANLKSQVNRMLANAKLSAPTVIDPAQLQQLIGALQNLPANAGVNNLNPQQLQQLLQGIQMAPVVQQQVQQVVQQQVQQQRKKRLRH
jgi:hypothetical protein